MESEDNVDSDYGDNTVENDTEQVQQFFPNASLLLNKSNCSNAVMMRDIIYYKLINVRWLKLHHPESCPNDVSDCELNNDSIISHLPDISPASPALFSIEESEELAKAGMPGLKKFGKIYCIVNITLVMLSVFIQNENS